MPSSALKKRRPRKATQSSSSAASDVYKRQQWNGMKWKGIHWNQPEWNGMERTGMELSLIHISEPTRLGMISYAVFCLKKTATTEIYTEEIVGSVRCVEETAMEWNEMERNTLESTRVEWNGKDWNGAVSYTHLRAHETRHDLVCRLLLEKNGDHRDLHRVDRRQRQMCIRESNGME